MKAISQPRCRRPKQSGHTRISAKFRKLFLLVRTGRAWCRPRAMDVHSRCKLSVEADGDTDRTMAQTSATHCPKGNEKLVFVVPIMPYGYRAAAPCRNADVMNITKFPITCETVLTVTSSSVLVL